MKTDDIRNLAKNLDIKPGKLNKTELVRSIQRKEGNFDCFASAANGDCDQFYCFWREDCFAAAVVKPAAVKKAVTKKKTVTKKKAAPKKKAATKEKPAAKKKSATKKKVAKKNSKS